MTRSRRTIGAAAWLGLACSCVDLETFGCADDGQCRRGQTPGVCAGPGFCAYEDESCDASGLRYSDLAGEGLANACVDPNGGATDDATAEGDAVCGNGQVEGGEDCDDGNDVDGDGCNVGCIPSGSVLWSVRVAGSDGARDRVEDLAALPTGDLVVAGALAEGGEDLAYVARIAIDDGARVWEWRGEGEGDRSVASAVGIDADNRIGVGGTSETGDGPSQGWLRAFATDGSETWVQSLNAASVLGVAGNVEGFIAVGGAFAGEFDATATAVGCDGQIRWSHETDVPGDDLFTDVTSRGFDVAYAVSANNSDVVLTRVDAGGLTDVRTWAGDFGERDDAQGMTTHPSGDLLLAGFQTTTLGHDMWIARATEAGDDVWMDLPPGALSPVDEELEDVAVDPVGDVYAVGFVTNEDKDVVVVKYTAAGELVYSRVFVDLGGPGDDIARGIAITADGGVVVAGEAIGDDGSADLWIARIAP